MRSAMFYLILFLAGYMARPYLYPEKHTKRVAANEPREIEGLVVQHLTVLGQKAMELQLDRYNKNILLFDMGSKVLPPVGNHVTCLAQPVQSINLNNRSYTVFKLVSNPPPLKAAETP